MSLTLQIVSLILLLYIVIRIEYTIASYQRANKLSSKPITEKPSTRIIQIKSDTLNTDEIVYIQAKHGGINILTVTSEHFYWESLNKVYQMLPGEFVQCHRSYLVNKNFITEYQTNSLRLKGQYDIPIGKSFKNILSR